MLETVRRVINPPYNFKDPFAVFILLFILLIVPIIALEAPKQPSGAKNSTENVGQLGGKVLTVQFASPIPGGSLEGIAKIAVRAEADEPLQELRILVDGKLVNLAKNPLLQKNSLQVVFELNSADFSNGAHQISALATSLNGKTNSETIKVTFNNPADTEPPIVNFVTPNTNSKLGGKVKVSLVATDNRAIATLKLLIDGSLVFSKPTSSYTYLWDLNSLPAGNHTLLATATDLSGNSSERLIQIYHSATSFTQ